MEAMAASIEMPGTPLRAPGRYRSDLERARLLVRAFAPLYLVLICATRSYLETVPFAGVQAASFYRSVHQVCWYLNAFLTSYFFFHLITRVPVRRLLWFSYAMTVLLLPVAYVALTGQKLYLEYHHGSAGKILSDVFSFVVTASHNHPVIIDGGVAMVGTGVMAWFYTRRPWRGVAMALAIFLTVNFYAVLWLGPEGYSGPLFHLPSGMSLQPFLASLHLTVACFVAVIWVASAGLFRSDARAWKLSALAGALAWTAFTALSLWSGYFTAAYDAAVCGLMSFTCVTLAVRALFRAAGVRGSAYAAALFTAILAAQIMILGPIFLKTQERYTQKSTTYHWEYMKKPFSDLRLLGPETVPGLSGDRPEERQPAPGAEGGRP